MGLFSKKEKPPCAICGGKVSALFPWKVDGQLVCNMCYGVVDLPQEIMDHITIEEFKKYRVFREENAQLKQRFKTTQQIDFGWFDDKFLFDQDNRLLCMDKKLRKTVYEGRQVVSFEIREDQEPLFKGSAEGLIRYTSTVPQRVMAMAPQIEQLRMQIQIRRDMELLLERREDENKDYRYRSLPPINIPVPFQKFIIEIQFEHPYHPSFAADKNAPVFDSGEPDINHYLALYNNDIQLMEELARALMDVAFPGAPEQTVAAAVVTAAGSDNVSSSGMVEELQRLKDLMDKGILTEEEFTAKKRQMLGISLSPPAPGTASAPDE